MTIPGIWPGCAPRRARAPRELVWSVMLAGIAECGIPSMSLTDNGIVYTGRLHGYESAFETNLRALGVHTINSTPYHPQTCGKIERFWQTLKKWLRARPRRPPSTNSTTLLGPVPRLLQPPPTTPRAARSHPAEAFTATEKARPADRPLPAPVFVSRHTVGEKSGNLFVPPYKVNVGLRWAGHECDIIRDGDHIAIFSGTTLVRDSPPTPPATTNPATKTREPIAPANPNRHHECQRCPET